MSLEKEFSEVEDIFGFNPKDLIDVVVCDFKIVEYLGHGKVGVVFRGVNEYDFTAAVKIIPNNTLKDGWEEELIKLRLLEGIKGIAHYKNHGSVIVKTKERSEACICILYDFIKGQSLGNYIQNNKNSITIDFILQLTLQTLSVFQALKVTNITHGDLHPGNIMIENPDERQLSQTTKFVITDFGQGGSTKNLNPQNDYLQLSLMCKNILNQNIEYFLLDGKNKFIYDNFNMFLERELIEEDALIDDFVQNPRILFNIIESIKTNYKYMSQNSSDLQSPFDYLSCEHIGNSYDLLQSLYSTKFPGNSDLLQKTNTIFTGPRGCGKSTIFKNLSLKTLLLAGSDTSNLTLNYIGIYYNCKDLYFAFPYEITQITDLVRKQVTHYFNLALFYEILDSLMIAYDKGFLISHSTFDKLQGVIKSWFPEYEMLPSETIVISHLSSFINKTKQDYRNSLVKDYKHIPNNVTPEYFLLNLSQIITGNPGWLNNVPLYIFLDDYSTPKIQENLQKILNSMIFMRHSELYYKVSTESIITFVEIDASNKLMADDREYDVLDFGDLFLHASWDTRSNFLKEIINKRFEKAILFDWDIKDITEILKKTSYKYYTDLARNIKSGSSVSYSGWKTIVDLCSGDIANILGLIRDIITRAENQDIKNIIPINIQDTEVRRTANTFLTRIEANQECGIHLRKITESFGNVANHWLRTRKSTNVNTKPPHQSFRIEIQEPLFFNNDKSVQRFTNMPDELELKKYYEHLIKYGIFIRDVRGKSQRGAVVPRLYLRRLLLPTFLLTPSQRDSLRLEVHEFKLLLSSPDRFERYMKNKPIPRDISDKQEKFK